MSTPISLFEMYCDLSRPTPINRPLQPIYSAFASRSRLVDCLQTFHTPPISAPVDRRERFEYGVCKIEGVSSGFHADAFIGKHKYITRTRGSMTEKGSQGMERQAPVLRVYLLGTFQAERADGTALAMESVFGRSHSEILFKLLLCHPERRVIREYLVDVLWPGQVYNVMEGSLGVAKSILKTRLDALCGQPVMPRASGDPPAYSLAGQSVLWTDIDACEQVIRQAVHTPDTQEAFSLWEAAYALLQRGELLADAQQAYWYLASLVQDRRKRLARQRVQCVLR